VPAADLSAPRPRTPSPARVAKYETERAALMRAAFELIGRNGSRATSVHDILDATGLSTRTFYRHFRSKDELVVAMYRVDSDRVTASLVAAVDAAPTPLDALDAWIGAYLDIAYDARRIRHARVLSSPEVASAEGFDAAHVEGSAAQRAPLVDALRRGRADGSLPAAQPEADAFAIQAVVVAHLRSRMERDGTLTRGEAHAYVVDLFRRALA